MAVHFTKFTASILACLAPASCVGIGGGASGGGTQSVVVTTPPAEGARCVLTGPSGTYYVITPGNAIIQKSRDALDIVCDKEGFQHAVQKIQPHFGIPNPVAMLAGGIVQLGLDAATGAIYTYPINIVVPMSKSAPAQRVTAR
jgi:hypothetical protein